MERQMIEERKLTASLFRDLYANYAADVKNFSFFLDNYDSFVQLGLGLALLELVCPYPHFSPIVERLLKEPSVLKSMNDNTFKMLLMSPSFKHEFLLNHFCEFVLNEKFEERCLVIRDYLVFTNDQRILAHYFKAFLTLNWDQFLFILSSFLQVQFYHFFSFPYIEQIITRYDKEVSPNFHLDLILFYLIEKEDTKKFLEPFYQHIEFFRKGCKGSFFQFLASNSEIAFNKIYLPFLNLYHSLESEEDKITIDRILTAFLQEENIQVFSNQLTHYFNRNENKPAMALKSGATTYPFQIGKTVVKIGAERFTPHCARKHFRLIPNRYKEFRRGTIIEQQPFIVQSAVDITQQYLLLRDLFLAGIFVADTHCLNWDSNNYGLLPDYQMAYFNGYSSVHDLPDYFKENPYVLLDIDFIYTCKDDGWQKKMYDVLNLLHGYEKDNGLTLTKKPR